MPAAACDLAKTKSKRHLFTGPYPPRYRIDDGDNLKTHDLASLYEMFLLTEAGRLAEHIEIHYTPKLGSWLNIAEI